jgi:hypothetical protein
MWNTIMMQKWNFKINAKFNASYTFNVNTIFCAFKEDERVWVLMACINYGANTICFWVCQLDKITLNH